MVIAEMMITYEEIVSKALNTEFKKEMQTKNKGKIQHRGGQEKNTQQAWKREKVDSGAGKATLVAQTKAPNQPNTCCKYGVAGHIAKDCRSAPEKPKCYYCGEIGHVIRDCTKLVHPMVPVIIVEDMATMLRIARSQRRTLRLDKVVMQGYTR